MTSSQDLDGPGLDGHQGTAQPFSGSEVQPLPTPSTAPPRQDQEPPVQEKEQVPAQPRSTVDENNNLKPVDGDVPSQPITKPSAPQEEPPLKPADKEETMGDAVQTWLEAQPPPSQLAQPQADDDTSAHQIATNSQSQEDVLPQQSGWDGNGTLVPDEMHMAATNLLMGSQAMASGLALPYLPYQLPVPGVHYNIGYAPDNDADLDADSDDGDSIFDASKFPRMPRLRFEDSVFQFTTNTVIIGRDQVAYKRALASRKRVEKGLPPEEEGREPHGNYSKSYVSQSGGALGPESDGEERPRPSKRRKTAANGQPEDAPPHAMGMTGQKAYGNLISSRQYVDHTPGAVPVDIDALRPSPDDVVKVQIHGPGPDIIATTKGISREHLKIQYNQRERVWQAFPLGRNGFFCEDVLYGKNDVVNLHSGDELQIQSVTFIFDINGVPDGMLGNEGPRTYSEGGKEMSFDFQSSRGEEIMRDTSESLPSDPVMDKLDEETVESDPPDHRDASKEGSMSANPEGLPHSLLPPKKRGPGRPPKNGIMSKREERELKKKAQEEAKKNAPPQEPGEPPIKRKVGRPRKHPLPEDADDQPEKRKYKPRKPKTEDGEAEEDPDGEKADKHKRLQKPKTPPLDLGDVKDWPEEKLQKPNKNYQLLIDEVLSAAPDGLTLKQIYKRIAKAYPYFHFKCDSKGWESSVRHNLIGSHCFQKNNETHLWKRVEGIPLDAGKKRKPSDSASEARPSPMYNGNYNPAYQHTPHPQQYANHQMPQIPGPPHANLPPRYPPNGQAYQVPATNPIQPGTTPHPQAGAVRQGFPPHQPPTAIPQPNGYAAANATPRPQYTGTQPPTYNSAYNNRPQSTPLANAGVAGFPATQNHAQNPLLARPGQSASGIPPNGLPIANPGITQHPPRPMNSPHQQPPVPNSAPPAPLGPVIDPSLRDFIRSFAREVVKQLQNRVLRPEAVAVSVVNRGLGLTKKSLTPEAESYEKAILNIFQAHKLTYSKPKTAAASTTATASATTAPSPVTPASVPGGNGAAPASGSLPAPPTPTSATAAPTVNGPPGAASQASGAGAVNGTAADSAINSTTTTGAAVPGTGHAGSSNPTPAPAGTAPANPTATGSTIPSSTVAAPSNPASSNNADVQLLDPKLVELVQQYKKLSMDIIIPRVGAARGEILIMSAINRVLGFTEESIMSYKGEKNKEHLVEAEKALMQSLKHRIDTYLRCRRVSAAPATPAPAPR
ncbi:hypothetical protein VMCG_10661 [Cytospora schulzeri]|uniref:Fork-head domain-containing protein n=1 Tax=Cytospora schulzeri TaxID=448051 RepID=A0A423V8K9_9PEZI|nr:hypothetical protein VMCG_10661 [Valsa malicola]